jgi:hypothetical protein
MSLTLGNHSGELMKFNSFKTLALVTTAMVGLSMPINVNAAPNALVTVDIETQAGITAATQQDMDFGSWLIGVHPGDNPTVVLEPDGDLTTTTGVGSQLIELTGATTGDVGEVLVTLPTGADGITVQMSRGAITPFADGSLVLGTITYLNSDDVLQTGTLLENDPGKPITVDVGATGATVSLGGTVTASATPVGDGVVHTASFNVSFAY